MAAQAPAPPSSPPSAAAKPSTGSSVTDVYMRQLEASKNTTTTAPVGPTSESATATPSAPPTSASQQLAALNTARPATQVPQRPTQGISAQVASIEFGNNSAVLSKKARAELRKVARMHKELGGRVRVIGHASSRTKDLDVAQHLLVNYQISVKRANAVAQALAKYGVKPINMDVSARSDTEPIYYEVMPRGEAHNRRTEIYLDY
jgi:outer membrane protein OmpA-like peptidoglycan-associated protein